MQLKLGGTRFVLVFKSFVIKIPYPLWRRGMYGVLSNLEESYKWKTNKHWEKYYCPVIFCFPGGLFLIMKRAETICSKDRIMYFLQTMIHEDITYKNIGVFEGRQVLIDYGITAHRIVKRKLNSISKFLFDLREKINKQC